jgi:biotin carboxylase
MSMQQESELTSEIQRLLTLLKMQTTIYNIETRVGTNGKPYIMEVSPRGGGNRLAEMVHFSTGINLIENAVRAAVGMPTVGIRQENYTGHWAEVVLHAEKDGQFEQLNINDEFKKKYVHQIDLWVNPGDKVSAFRGANDSLGTLVLKFSSETELQYSLAHQSEWMSVIVK